MKLALAQIDARLGDFDGICSRVERQLHVAHDAGADLLCLPAPLLCGVTPGALVESGDFEHDMLKSLHRISKVAEELGIDPGDRMREMYCELLNGKEPMQKSAE